MVLCGNRSLCYADNNSTQSNNQDYVGVVITNELIKDTMVLLMGSGACTAFTQFSGQFIFHKRVPVDKLRILFPVSILRVEVR